MRTCLGVVAGLLLAGVLAADRAPDRADGVLDPLRPGRRVTITELPGGYVVGVLPGADIGHTVTEVGADYLVVEDDAGAEKLRLPVTQIRAGRISKPPLAGR